MKAPTGYKFKLDSYTFEGPLRPKGFWQVALIKEGDEHGCQINQYVRQIPFLARLRLWLAARACLKMHRKFAKFCRNQGL